MASAAGPGSDQPVFYYDLGSPQCYIVAETIMATLSVVPEWEPVLASRITGSNPRDEPEPKPEPDRMRIAALGAEHGLQPLRWPPNWPPDTEQAMLAATYAKQIGRGVAFSLAAFRQAFAGGRDLSDKNTILIAGAACEMHPVALERGIALRSTAQALTKAGERARAAGVTSLPAVQTAECVFAGIEAATEAALALGEAR